MALDEGGEDFHQRQIAPMAPNEPTVTLREYVDVRFDAQDKAINAALAATKEATAAALATYNNAIKD